MKKFGLFLLGLCFFGVVMAQPVIQFAEPVHDFGRIFEQDGNVHHEFRFVNVGNAPLLVTNARSGCGCAGATWTRTPVAPGDSGIIVATYNPTGRPGAFNRAFAVSTNMPDEHIVRIFIRGEVIRRAE